MYKSTEEEFPYGAFRRLLTPLAALLVIKTKKWPPPSQRLGGGGFSHPRPNPKGKYKIDVNPFGYLRRLWAVGPADLYLCINIKICMYVFAYIYGLYRWIWRLQASTSMDFEAPGIEIDGFGGSRHENRWNWRLRTWTWMDFEAWSLQIHRFLCLELPNPSMLMPGASKSIDLDEIGRAHV